MATPLEEILSVLRAIAKVSKQVEIRCPGCGERHRWIRHGHYRRYGIPGHEETIYVPRFLCLNPFCRRVTFSVLPYPFLRWIRFPLCLLLVWGASHEQGRARVSELAARHKSSWAVMRRAIERGGQVWGLMKRDQGHEGWGLWPCRAPARYWTAFTQWLWQAIYPARPVFSVTHIFHLSP
jgi:hypothetical protein